MIHLILIVIHLIHLILIFMSNLMIMITLTSWRGLAIAGIIPLSGRDT